MVDKIAEGTMASVAGGVALGWLPILLGIPAGAYYSLKFYRLWKNKKAS